MPCSKPRRQNRTGLVLESLTEGATYLAQRGVIPSASVWIPFGKPVGSCGRNVCVERDIYRWVSGNLPR